MIYVCVLIFITLLIFINMQYKKTNYYNNLMVFTKDFHQIYPGVKCINLGSTYSKFAFATYDDMNIKGVNFALQSESLEMDYAILKEYSKYFSDHALVFIPISPCLMLYTTTNAKIATEVLSKKNNPCYSMFCTLQREMPILFNPKVVKRILKDSEFRYQDIYDSTKVFVTGEEAKKCLDSLVQVWLKLFHISNLMDHHMTPENEKILKKNKTILLQIVEYCLENKLKPIIVLTPFSDSLNYYFSKEFKQAVMYNIIQEIAADLDIIILDYEEDVFFGSRPNLFVDGGFCLNRRGSEILLRRIYQDLWNLDPQLCDILRR